ncbi:unnamed protein product [Brassicogethes aeneus]|uniref:Uncharacterized protein n=1 Tax=Brassicogethes aeneus TaxID=1431903 RepID=A0A9P0BEW7_BRAAE|nr:unnamed protein product [Brassicogethes aeneus]
MIIGIYWGKGKPSDLTKFLQSFLEAATATEILKEGIIVKNTLKIIKIRSFICDSPSRSFLKGVANFNSQHGCQKCTVEGQYSYLSRTNYFPQKACEKRTDYGFRTKQDELHHKYDSPLLKLPIDMIQDFPIGYSLHLLNLGIMKKILCGWRDGKFGNSKTKWKK